MPSHPSSYCAKLTRDHDRNRYLCALFAPVEVREAWFTMFAFQHEITSIAHKVGEEMVGFIRYAWWRETLDAVFKGVPPRGHPVAEALGTTVKRLSLPRAPFDAIIEAHERAMAEKRELDEAFLEATATPLMLLCAVSAYSNVIPAQAGIPIASVKAVDNEIPAYAGMTQERLRVLAISFAAIEAALLPHTTEEHKTQFIALARTRLTQAKPVGDLFAPFAHTVEFYLRRMERG
jgi:Squalene/phytoene synthase